MVLGLLVLSVLPGTDPVCELSIAAAMAVLVAWVPWLLLPSGSHRRRTRGRSTSRRRPWLRVILAALAVGLGSVLGLWWQAPLPMLILTASVWATVLITGLVSRLRPVCRHTAVTGVIAAAVAVALRPPGAAALFLVVLVGTASVRSGRRGPAAVVGGAVLGLVLGAAPLLLWG
jgi:hypothetical protein